MHILINCTHFLKLIFAFKPFIDTQECKFVILASRLRKLFLTRLVQCRGYRAGVLVTFMFVLHSTCMTEFLWKFEIAVHMKFWTFFVPHAEILSHYSLLGDIFSSFVNRHEREWFPTTKKVLHNIASEKFVIHERRREKKSVFVVMVVKVETASLCAVNDMIACLTIRMRSEMHFVKGTTITSLLKWNEEWFMLISTNFYHNRVIMWLRSHII